MILQATRYIEQSVVAYLGPLGVRGSIRPAHHRLGSWAGVGPITGAQDDTLDVGRRVVGVAVHAGPLLVLCSWR